MQNAAKYDFLDFGTSKGGSIDFAVRRLGGTAGIGIDIDPNKVSETHRKGYDCIQGDFTQLPILPDSVRFVTMIHVLEHLPDIPAIKKAIKSAAIVASDFLVIIGPWFDADGYLSRVGFKFFWSNWTGHSYHLQTKELKQILIDLGLENYVIMAHGRVKDSLDPTIHPLDSPRDQHEYDSKIHPIKPLVPFSQTVYKEMICYVQLRPLENWDEVIKARGEGSVVFENTIDNRAQEKGYLEQEQLLSPVSDKEQPIYKYSERFKENGRLMQVPEFLYNEKPIPPEINRRRIELFWHTYQWLEKSLPAKPYRKWIVFEGGQGKFGWSDLYLHFFDKVYAGDIEDYSHYHPGVISIQSDFSRNIPLGDKSIDLVVSHSVLEHVENVLAVLSNFDRILKVGGYIFITAAPLYYSAEGSHINHPTKLKNWEHLNPKSDYYLIDNPLRGKTTSKGHELNKMTFSEFMGFVGKMPWSIIRSKLQIDPRPIPNYVNQEIWPEMDLRTRGFFLLAMKEFHCTNPIHQFGN